MPGKVGRPLTALTAALLLVACGQATPLAQPLEPTLETVCALDGMALQDFPGPKAQVHYSEGKPDYYCDLMELFGILLAPEHKRKVSAVYVQDMGKAEWARPTGRWIAAKDALYVVGSRKQGSMGPTFGAFSSAQDAAAFVEREGGTVVPFDQVTAAMLDTDGAAGDARH